MAADLLRENGLRLLMRVLQAAGDRPPAPRAYHVCAVTLESELGLEPSAATRALRDVITAAAPAGTGGSAVPRSPFVGRAAELTRLMAICARRRPGGHSWSSFAARPGSARRGWWRSCASAWAR